MYWNLDRNRFSDKIKGNGTAELIRELACGFTKIK